MEERKASYTRTTGETDITIAINLDGAGVASVDTGIRCSYGSMRL